MSTTQFALPFKPSARRLGRPSEPILRDADVEGDYRWTLKRVWGAGPCILWCGLNPSTADAKRDDPTMLREIGFSYRWGFGSLVKVNIYPFISSTPDKLRAWIKTFDWETYQDLGMRAWDLDKSSWSAFHHNMGVVEGLIAEDTVCVAAWGAGVYGADLEQFFNGVCRRVDASEHDGFIGPIEVEWQCLGTNADGSPKHTLARGTRRVPDEAKLQPWKAPR